MIDISPEDQEKFTRRAVLAEIDELEKQQSRAVREFIAGRDAAAAKKKIEQIDDQIAVLRAQLAQGEGP